MKFPWSRGEKKTYESLRDALYSTGPHPIRPDMGFAPLAIGYVDGGARFTRRNDRMEIICHVIVGVSEDVKISDPYSEIRRKDDNFNYKAKTHFRHPKKIRLEKTVGYLNGEATFGEVQPLIEALVHRYFLREMQQLTPADSPLFISKSKELADLDREIAGYPKFEPI